MYLELEGRMFLPVKQETYNDLWKSITDEDGRNVGIQEVTIGGVVIVVDSPHFREWVTKRK